MMGLAPFPLGETTPMPGPDVSARRRCGTPGTGATVRRRTHDGTRMTASQAAGRMGNGGVDADTRPESSTHNGARTTPMGRGTRDALSPLGHPRWFFRDIGGGCVPLEVAAVLGCLLRRARRAEGQRNEPGCDQARREQGWAQADHRPSVLQLGLRSSPRRNRSGTSITGVSPSSTGTPERAAARSSDGARSRTARRMRGSSNAPMRSRRSVLRSISRSITNRRTTSPVSERLRTSRRRSDTS